MSNVVLTRQGLQYVLSAHDNGVYVDLRYFVPVYDDRIDQTVRDASILSAFTQIADIDATAPYGEVIWNTSGTYSLSNTDVYIISATSYTGGAMSDSYQKASVTTNLLDDIPLSNQISGTAFVVSAGSSAGLHDWTVTGGGAVSGVNTRPTSTTSDYFSIQDYYPVYDTSASGRLRGAYKAVLSQSIGTAKFNKLGLYAVQVDTDGTVLGTCYFGEAYIGYTPVIKTPLATSGFDHFIFDIQIDLSGTSATWDNVFFSSSADYWSHSPGGLYYPNLIGVGSFEDSVKQISATAHLKKARNESGVVDTALPILRMDCSTSAFVGFDVVSAGANVSGVNGGDLVIQVSDWTNYCSQHIAVRPKVARTVALGTNTYPFASLSVNDYLDHAIDVNNGQVKIGKLNGFPESAYYGIPSVYLSNLGIEITASTGATNPFGAYVGGDLYRKYENLFIFTTFYCTGGTEYYDKDIAIVAGLDTSGSYSAIGTPSGKINHYSLTKQLLIDQNFSTNVASAAELHLAAKGGVKLHGVLELENVRNGYTTGGTSYTHNNAMILTKKDNLLVVAGMSNSTTYDTLNTYLTNDADFCGLIDSTGQLVLAGYNIKTVGNISPWVTNVDDLGTTSYRYKNVYVYSRIYEANRTTGMGYWASLTLPTSTTMSWVQTNTGVETITVSPISDYSYARRSLIGYTSIAQYYLGMGCAVSPVTATTNDITSITIPILAIEPTSQIYGKKSGIDVRLYNSSSVDITNNYQVTYVPSTSKLTITSDAATPLNDQTLTGQLTTPEFYVSITIIDGQNG
jgi:hypothetical protein